MFTFNNQLALCDFTSSIVEKLDIPSEFGHDPDDDYDDFCNVTYDVKEDIRTTSGASKLVIIDNRSSVVIKVPFNGSWVYNDTYWKAQDEYEENNCFGDAPEDIYDYDEIHEFCPFKGGYYRDKENEISEYCWDYCKIEVLEYEKAKRAGFEKYFAKIELYEVKHHHPIYIQERCIAGAYATDKEPSERSYKKAKEEFKFSPFGSAYWVAAFIDAYGEEELKRFTKYVDDNIALSTDLHADNLGYTIDGRPVLIDYSGFES